MQTLLNFPPQEARRERQVDLAQNIHRSAPKFFRDLSDNERNLLCKIQSLGWGYVENIFLIQGEPLICPGTKFRRTIRLKSKAEAMPELTNDTLLKSQHSEFVQVLRSISNGLISKIEVRDGLPAELSMEEVA